MVSVGIIRARSVSTRGMRWTGLNFRVGMRPGLARQMQPRRIQWIKTERREDRSRCGPRPRRKMEANLEYGIMYTRTCQPRAVGSESGLH
ncbi:hypothetical protein EV363DRAFT_1263353 [Boletus edulis]|nr:hypothetical protein EV363DRAFT_1263353 [Boletus edulis]